MTNKEWLDYLAHNAPDELAAWFDAEHAESTTSATMQHIGQVIEDTVKRGVYGDTEPENGNTDAVSERYATAFKWLDRLNYGKGGVIDNSLCDTPEQGEVVMPLESWREHLDTEPESEDSREQLEADIEEWAAVMNIEGYQLDMIHGWLNRRAAILEREMVKFNRRYFDCVEQEKKIAELTRKMEILKAHGVEIVDAVAGGYEVYNEKIREVSELQAQVDTLKSRHCPHYHANEHTCDVHETRIAELTVERDNAREESVELYSDLIKASDEREHYREKFGKCLDYADAIHALMDDEGMA